MAEDVADIDIVLQFAVDVYDTGRRASRIRSHRFMAQYNNSLAILPTVCTASQNMATIVVEVEFGFNAILNCSAFLFFRRNLVVFV